MLRKVIGIWLLLLYVNAIPYHETIIIDEANNSLNTGITMVNIVLDEALDIPIKADQEISDVPYDDYRLGSPTDTVFPVLLLLFFIPFYNRVVEICRPSYKRLNKLIPLQLGYYKYLVRLKLF